MYRPFYSDATLVKYIIILNLIVSYDRELITCYNLMIEMIYRSIRTLLVTLYILIQWRCDIQIVLNR